MKQHATNGSTGDGGGRRSPWSFLLTGATGAATVTLAHEAVRQLIPRAPRMDYLGMAALSRGLQAIGIAAPRGKKLRRYALAGDIGGNALYYAPLALVGLRKPVLGGIALGTLAGIGALYLTPAIGLPRRHRGLTTRAKVITVALYALGGLVAGGVASFLDRGRRAKLTTPKLIANRNLEAARRTSESPQEMTRKGEIDPVVGSAM